MMMIQILSLTMDRLSSWASKASLSTWLKDLSREAQIFRLPATTSTMVETCFASQTSSTLKALEWIMSSTRVLWALSQHQVGIQSHQRNHPWQRAQEMQPAPTTTRRSFIATIWLIGNSLKSTRASSRLEAQTESNQWILTIDTHFLKRFCKLIQDF